MTRSTKGDHIKYKTAARWSLLCDVKMQDMAVLCLNVTTSDLLCIGSTDKTIGLWCRNAGSEPTKLGVVRGHEGLVKCLKVAWCRVSNGCMAAEP
ncbi:hypothetical protein PR202_gb03780 [Eleusine coracana subsp. coracana]|uniref:Uncharacterized protein n=1 Tax=Eleusine coracana subsp. coracana TaxID=191504 RepID=A0AAV5E2W1_ELECO|nr:hypothetical protein PR202_gb03780 [Eleusine coracana subsp. coracana]